MHNCCEIIISIFKLTQIQFFFISDGILDFCIWMNPREVNTCAFRFINNDFIHRIESQEVVQVLLIHVIHFISSVKKRDFPYCCYMIRIIS